MIKTLVPAVFCVLLQLSASAQIPKTELFDLVKKFLFDSTGYETVGDWGVGQPKKYPVKWKSDKIEMSDNLDINFYRLGDADITINGRSFKQNGQPVKWNLMLKGARSGYSSFSIISSPSSELTPKYTIDSIFGKKPYAAKLLKSCDAKTLNGHYYYEVKLLKKDLAFIKVSWVNINNNTAIRIDCYDSWSKQYAKTDCPK